MSSIMDFDPKEIDRAGRILAGTEGDGTDAEYNGAVRLVGAWRASHSHPLNTFRANLQRRAGEDGLVAQRLKRLPSIIGKLKRLKWLRLSQMRDIGGCRVVVPQIEDAYRIASDMADSRIHHDLIHSDNYIQEPRRTGYRSLHLAYEYRTDRKPEYDGRRIEIQLRSRLQHQWATAVETVGTFIGDELKSGHGSKAWLRFFALMSTAIALREGYPIAPNTPSDPDRLTSEILECDEGVGILNRLNTIQYLSGVLTEQPNFRDSTIVLEMNVEEQSVFIWAYRRSDVNAANGLYMEREQAARDNPRLDVVLVSAKSLTALRSAYPNYFMDIAEFRRLVSETVGKP